MNGVQTTLNYAEVIDLHTHKEMKRIYTYMHTRHDINDLLAVND